MARTHLFEWEDQPWLPRSLRDYITDHLRNTFSAPRAANLRQTVADILAPAIARSGATRIVDVCSGGGGPLPSVLPLLTQSAGRPLTATLTDLYPNARAFAAVAQTSGGTIAGEMRAISAFDVPDELGSFQTLFTAFHHFDPNGARKVIDDAVRKKRTLAIVEPFARRNFWLVMIGGFVRGIVLTPFVGRMDWKRFLWTYPIPVSAFVLAWDGAVSCLRAYAPEEMLAMGRAIAPDTYEWEAGFRPIPGAPGGLGITYMIGWPKQD